MPLSEFLDNPSKTSFSPPIVVDGRVVAGVVQVVVRVAVVVVAVVVHVGDRVLSRVAGADLRSVVVCVRERHIGGGVCKLKRIKIQDLSKLKSVWK